MVKVKRALISVSDKRNLEEFVKGLNTFGVEILSTGGTAKAISSLGVAVKQVSDYTGFPEMLDGRVKTLHPKIHGGLLALRQNQEHIFQLKEHDIGLIDMVVVNLYPFGNVIKREGVKLEDAIENIDIGGPSMLRSGSKNFRSVAVICNPDRYAEVLNEMRRNNGAIGDETLEKLAVEVFEHTSRYDAAIAAYLGEKLLKHAADFPANLNLSFKKAQDLRYGENPHQRAAFYKDDGIDEPGVSRARQLHGKELSFNNILDLNAAIEIVKDFEEPAVSIIKHTNPCGAATAKTPKKAFLDALNCDRLSAFGCIVGFNKRIEQDTAKTILDEADFVECIIAPSYDPKALDQLKKKKNLRLLEIPGFGAVTKKRDLDMKKVVGGLLVQDRDLKNDAALKVVTRKKPAKAELESLLFAWKISKHVKSNAIVLSKGTKTVGVGAGQMSRVDSVIIAARKAGKLAKSSCMASDAFFPKEDAVQMAKKAGVKAIIQPGGSIRDAEVIKAADKAGIAMVFTGVRHFKH
ncbi:MAG: bifunctional phosphoribosylaminoimidazolecarboxamide formyltransferase/IMP cyclohydrolase [Candidatus Omnitrophica bacterium]|nr:bifunctional phosphoribosylaminoimidazolecarboxamide formyltransferase/IMP cyclohydrolase [Candidatus Omnitrophota bacterium]